MMSSVLKEFDTQQDFSIDNLKNLLFKVAECNAKTNDRKDWANVSCYSELEKYENQSIFTEKHPEILFDKEAEYATVSSTVMILTTDN
eukprot:CAMPEP_0170561716 /NCGR_PEP_ID=MMETSP0211-20121228/56503_1 /TAXON_ID=311385 /ORGANISM="Pseudokeronopsis sp., Strain OXSARD2" /LENGTH=87 /DNA_ID=CAMNT_0010877645 /DNA_START=322 /DNA_END=585 /DNA_ORIENTATION=+